MSDEGRPACEIHKDEDGDVFVLVGGVKIAKRGLPDTAYANRWIMLEPGWIVRDIKGGRERAIAHMKEHQGVWFATGSEIIDAYQKVA
jgi:hypothetical protein